MKTVLEYVKKNNLFSPKDNIILGVSGGADSVCLLYIMNELKKEYGLSLTAVHINHMIRETAGRDEEFAKNLCEKLHTDFLSYKTDCPAISKRDGISLEEAGRNERYRLFNETGKKLYKEGNYKIAVAHHMDDLAETLIFNMARGTGIAGLSSLKPVKDNIVRPLLCVNRAWIEDFLKEKGLEHIEDETNLSDEYARNKIRHKIIPTMNEITEKAVNHMAGCAETLGEIDDYLSGKTDELWERYVDAKEGVFIKDEIISVHPALVKRVILKALVFEAGRARDISGVQIEAVLSLFSCQTGRKRDLIYGMEARRDYGGVRIISKKTDEGDGEEILKRLSFEIKERDFSKNIPTDLYTKWFDYDKIKNCPRVRFRQDGDYITINDENQKKLLSDYMTNEKIPLSKRDEIPLLADGEHILWVVGHRISNYYKVGSDTKRILIATYCKKAEPEE
ncbi:MAG: tRNA lysidine(34) synthetase TilS [Lachnospiraceae bacterium]|nr:tRNA lysidine(34) synthetase TilS [Lachnospiraceae bacterium]